MKQTFLDRLIGMFSPSAAYNRVNARVKTEATLRAFDIAKTFPTSDWVSANGNSANVELKDAIKPGREKGRALTQNAPYAVKAVDVIVSETVGAGIIPQITGRNQTQTKKLQELWKKWAESTDCDFEKRNNFYAIQELVMRSVVESGEGLVIKRVDNTGMPKLHILEPDFIATDLDDGRLVQGIEVSNGVKTKYHLYKLHPGEKITTKETVSVPVENLAHVFRQKRAGQLRGITWAHAVAEKLKDHDDYQYASLVRQKVAACFGGFVTAPANDQFLDAADLKARREGEFQLEPYTVKYLQPGEDFKHSSPPSVDGYSDFNRETLRDVAAGWGISYESMTGDYSQSNYSSSRMGHIQMRKNIEMWRWNMFIPQFNDTVFKWFTQWVELTTGIPASDVKVKWVPPAYSYIDPIKEIEATVKEVRAGLKSMPEAIKEQGGDPDEVLNEVAEWNEKLDKSKVILDTDPRKMSTAGQFQSVDNSSMNSEVNDSEENKKTTTE